MTVFWMTVDDRHNDGYMHNIKQEHIRQKNIIELVWEQVISNMHNKFKQDTWKTI